MMKRILPLALASLMATTTPAAQDAVTDNSLGIAAQAYAPAQKPSFDWSAAMDNSKADKPATYRGGNAEMLKDIARNLVYPATALEQQLQGRVVVQFGIDEKGKVVAVKVLKSLSPECDKAAAATVGKLGRFKPARHQGKAVPVWFVLPVNFRMQ